MKRVTLVLFAASGLAACGGGAALDAAPGPTPGPLDFPAPAPVEGYDWHLNRHAGQSSLAFGLAESDDVRIVLTCDDGSGRVELFRDVETDQPAEIHLEAGGETERFPAASEPSLLSGGQILTADAPLSRPVFQRFRSLRWLTAWQGGVREDYAPHPESSANIDAFFAACG